MNTHPLGQHLDTCSGPDDCSEYASLLRMGAHEHSAYLKILDGIEGDRRRTRNLSAALVLRTHCHAESTDVTTAAAPRPYSEHLSRLRAAATTPASSFEQQYKERRLASLLKERATRDTRLQDSQLTAASDEPNPSGYAAPPKPYSLALKKEQR